MATNDPSQYILRYNEISGVLEYGAGNIWTTVSLSNASGGITQLTGAVTAGPGSGSQVATIPALATVALTAQAADIGSTLLFTAPSTGLYVINMYWVTTATDAGAGTTVSVTLAWTDNSGAQSVDEIDGNLQISHFLQQLTVPIQVVSGQTVHYTVAGGGTYGTARYSLYITARLA